MRDVSSLSQPLQVALACFPGGVVQVEADAVTGYCRNLLATFRLTSRGAGSSSVSFTEIDVRVPMWGTKLGLLAQPSPSAREIAQGRAVDVQVGEPVFDSRFVVSAAPSDVVRALLEPAIRARLLRLYPIDVEPRDFGFCVAREGWIEDPAMIAESIDLACCIGAAVPRAVHEANRAAGGLGQVLQQVRASEVAQLASAQEAARARSHRTVVAVLLAVFLVVVVAIGIPVAIEIWGSGGSDHSGH